MEVTSFSQLVWKTTRPLMLVTGSRKSLSKSWGKMSFKMIMINVYVKPKPGRPKGSKNKKENIAGEAGSKFDTGKKRRGRPKGSCKKKKETAYRLDSQIERYDLVAEESISMLEDQVNKKENSDFVLECSKEPGIEKMTKGLMSESSSVQKRSSERLRTLLIDCENFHGVEVEETIDPALESSDLMDGTRRKKEPRTSVAVSAGRSVGVVLSFVPSAKDRNIVMSA